MGNFLATGHSEAAVLTQLLRQRRSQPVRQDAVDADIRDRCLTTCAIVVVDMAELFPLDPH